VFSAAGEYPPPGATAAPVGDTSLPGGAASMWLDELCPVTERNAAETSLHSNTTSCSPTPGSFRPGELQAGVAYWPSSGRGEMGVLSTRPAYREARLRPGALMRPSRCRRRTRRRMGTTKAARSAHSPPPHTHTHDCPPGHVPRASPSPLPSSRKGGGAAKHPSRSKGISRLPIAPFLPRLPY